MTRTPNANPTPQCLLLCRRPPEITECPAHDPGNVLLCPYAEPDTGLAEDLLAETDLPEDAPGLLDEPVDYEYLLRSFDMVFRLHQRSEEIRALLQDVDDIILTARVVGDLADNLMAALKNHLAVPSVRILFKEGSAAALLARAGQLGRDHILSAECFDTMGLSQAGCFILDEPEGQLGQALFGDQGPPVRSAIAALLASDGEEMGLLALGSDDPGRYCGGTNAELVGCLARKISLGLANAVDHEKRLARALRGPADGLYSPSFFHEYLHKEFQRAWRYHSVFAIGAVTWQVAGAWGPSSHELAELLTTHLRCSDIAAEDGDHGYWILMPDTPIDRAVTALRRLAHWTEERFGEGAVLYAGVAEFSRAALVPSTIAETALQARKTAELYRDHQIVTRSHADQEAHRFDAMENLPG